MRAYVIYLILVIYIYLVTSEKYENKSSSSEEDYDEEPEVIPAAETVLDLRGIVRKLFAVEMGLNAEVNQNVICSPLAAMMPLAKLIFGARKKSRTETALLSALGLKTRAEVKYVYKRLINKIEVLEDVAIAVASRFYLSKTKKLEQKFINKSESIFRSSIELVDTNKPDEVAEDINDWISENTNDIIRNVINASDIGADSSLILVNCLCFKGRWAEPFQEGQHHNFYTPSSTKVVTMITTSGIYNYFQSRELNSQILEIPYVGHRSAMIIVLPDLNNGLQIVLRTIKIEPELLNKALMNMKPLGVSVTIPKFKIETRVDMKNYYKKMRLKNIISREHSDLDRIAKDEVLYVSNGIQQAIMDVNEIGTMIPTLSVLPDINSLSNGKFMFVADRPFLFYIRVGHEQLLAGVVNEP